MTEKSPAPESERSGSESSCSYERGPAGEVADPGRLRLGWLALGLLICLAHWRLESRLPLSTDFVNALVFTTSREGTFWVGSYFLLTPGLLLVVWATLPVTAELAKRSLGRLSAPPSRLAGFALAAFWTLLARGSRWLYALDLPVVSDEWAAEFGAKIWAAGALSAPAFDKAWGFAPAYVQMAGGRMWSYDFPGILAFHGFSLWSGLEHWLFAAFAALSGLVLARAAALFGGARAFWVAAVVWTCSPMIWSLSLTMHSHLVSRSLVALAFAALLHWQAARGEGRPVAAKVAVALGAAAAAAAMVRPAEAFFVLGPVGIYLVADAWSERQWRPALWAGALAASCLPLHLLYNLALTGSALKMPRVSEAAELATFRHTVFDDFDLLGTNAGFNLLMLVIFFVGPWLLALIPAALNGDHPRLARMLLASVLGHLALGLLHENTGVHMVGPIHYSESAVPLLLLVVLGVPVLQRLLERHGWSRPALLVMGLAVAVSLVAFAAGNARFIAEQAKINVAPLIATAGLPPSIVIADPYIELWRQRPEFRSGSWTFQFEPPDPFLRARVLFAERDKADPAALARDFPDRQILRLTYARSGPPFRFEPVAPGASAAPP